jgi:plastocyanin
MKTLALFATVLLAAVPAAQDVKVEISDKGFSPQQAEVTVGSKVIWMNVSKHEHTVTARAAAEPQDEKDKSKPMFDSGPIKPGMSFEYKFDKPGTYSYGCSIDKTLTGVVVVTERK